MGFRHVTLDACNSGIVAAKRTEDRMIRYGGDHPARTLVTIYSSFGVNLKTLFVIRFIFLDIIKNVN